MARDILTLTEYGFYLEFKPNWVSCILFTKYDNSNIMPFTLDLLLPPSPWSSWNSQIYFPPKFLNCSMYVQVTGKSRGNHLSIRSVTVTHHLKKFLLQAV